MKSSSLDEKVKLFNSQSTIGQTKQGSSSGGLVTPVESSQVNSKARLIEKDPINLLKNAILKKVKDESKRINTKKTRQDMLNKRISSHMDKVRRISGDKI